MLCLGFVIGVCKIGRMRPSSRTRGLEECFVPESFGLSQLLWEEVIVGGSYRRRKLSWRLGQIF